MKASPSLNVGELCGFLSFGDRLHNSSVPRVLGKNEGAMGTNDAMLYILW